MKKNIIYTSSLMALLTIAFIWQGCAKYEEGPSFTLVTKKNRLAGVWKVVKYNDFDMITPILEEFKENGFYKKTITILDKDITYTGEWSFENNKEVVRVNIQGSSEDYIIIRLTSEEFWYKDLDGKLWELVKQ